MTALERRLFSLGMYVVAICLVLVNPDTTNRAVRRLLDERLPK